MCTKLCHKILIDLTQFLSLRNKAGCVCIRTSFQLPTSETVGQLYEYLCVHYITVGHTNLIILISHILQKQHEHLWGRVTLVTLKALKISAVESLTHSWSWALLEKPPIVQLLKNFPTFYGTRRFINVFTRALHWSLSWARSIQFIPSHPTWNRSSKYIRLPFRRFYPLCRK
jgi:hypothetical protein